MKRFLLMGLPGTGKTTTLVACVEFFKKQGINANLIQTDTLINRRIKAEDPIIQQYEKDYELKIPTSIFKAGNPSKVFIEAYGEAAMRNLEERFLIDIIQTSQDDDWLDFGGRALLLPGVIKAAEAKKIIPIFLYADHETILSRLAENEGWRQRPTYMLAAEKSPDGKGWIANAELHRKERLGVFVKNAAIIVSVEKTPSDTSTESKTEEKQPKILYKSPEEIAREIFTTIKELEQNRTNSSPARFFENKPSGKCAGSNQFQTTKEWLVMNLKFRP